MRRYAAIALVAAAALAGCGADDRPPTPPAAAPPAPPSTAAARPPDPPPALEDGPPPAWVETATGASWLAYSTFCWGNTCADYVMPRSCDDEGVPRVAVRPGERIRFHLGFDPLEASLDFHDGSEVLRLAAVRDPEWLVTRGGAVALFVRSREPSEGADASYVACLELGAVDVGEIARLGLRGPLTARGFFHEEDDTSRLCAALAESHPPQCGGASLRLEGTDVELVDARRAAGVTWQDTPVEARGVVEDGVLRPEVG